MQPKITIITISYNSQATIEHTIRSVVEQDYPLLEYIIVDGKSNDATMQIVEKYRQQIAQVISEKDQGISDAFNKGIRLATGDMIGLINSDDVLLPGALRQMAAHYDGQTDVYRGNVLLWNDKNDARFRERPSMRFPMLPLHVHVAHQGTFITPEAYARYGMYDLRMRHPMDLELLRRFYRLGARMKQVDVDVALFRIGGVTFSSMDGKKEEYKLLVRLNGGRQWQADLYWAYLKGMDWFKSFLNHCFGEDFKRKVKYGLLKQKNSSQG